jgi:hypothetical protein
LPVGYNMQASAKFTAAWQTAPVRHYCGSRKFIPVSLFRNDGRDVGYINEIRRRLGLKGSSSQLLHQMLFNLNVVRHAKGSSELQSFLTQYA